MFLLCGTGVVDGGPPVLLGLFSPAAMGLLWCGRRTGASDWYSATQGAGMVE